MSEREAEERAADVRAVADHLAAQPDEITQLILEAHEAGKGDLGNVLASLAAVLEDRANVLRQLDEARGFADITQAIANMEQLTRERDEARAIARNVATALTTYGRETEGVDELEVLVTAWGDSPTGEPLPDWLTDEPQQQPGTPA